MVGGGADGGKLTTATITNKAATAATAIQGISDPRLAAAAPSLAEQLWQNLAPACTDVPHFGHLAPARVAPQFGQKLPLALVPQLEQLVVSVLGSLLVTHHSISDRHHVIVEAEGR